MKYNRLTRTFCHGALKLDISTLFKTFVLWTSLQFILLHHALHILCNDICTQRHSVFLAHLSTKCSVSFCDPSMSGVRRPSSVRPCVRASVRPSTISLNYISSKTAYWILTKPHRNDPWVVLYQSCSNRYSWLHK